MSLSSWASKRKMFAYFLLLYRQSAQTIRRLSEVLGESLSSHHDVLLQFLMKEILGRLWEGKDVILLAVGALSKSCHKAISAEGSTSSIVILNVVYSACTRKGQKYRETSFSSLDQDDPWMMMMV